jgi:DNA-binding HxlR family transcriptional regulator
METSCKARCLAYLKRNAGKWIAKGTICDLARTHGGYTGEMTGRRLRELEQAGEIKVQEVDGHAHYCWTEGSERKRLEGLAAFDAL